MSSYAANYAAEGLKARIVNNDHLSSMCGRYRPLYADGLIKKRFGRTKESRGRELSEKILNMSCAERIALGYNGTACTASRKGLRAKGRSMCTDLSRKSQR